MLLWVSYVVSTRHFRRDMDVATFMATICPIGALTVLPIAVTNADGLGMTTTGWTYVLILTFLSGVAANGLMVYAQKTIQIGTISVAQVVNPAIAVVFSFLLLSESVLLGQAIGIAIAMSGLAAFLWLNQRSELRRAV
jgi:drug/metabolite transporter (DMT)-like permease